MLHWRAQTRCAYYTRHGDGSSRIADVDLGVVVLRKLEAQLHLPVLDGRLRRAEVDRLAVADANVVAVARLVQRIERRQWALPAVQMVPAKGRRRRVPQVVLHIDLGRLAGDLRL